MEGLGYRWRVLDLGGGSWIWMDGLGSGWWVLVFGS